MSYNIARNKNVAALLKQRRRDEMFQRRMEQGSRRTVLQERGITLATPTHSHARERARRLRQIAAGRLRP